MQRTLGRNPTKTTWSGKNRAIPSQHRYRIPRPVIMDSARHQETGAGSEGSAATACHKVEDTWEN